MIRFIFRLIGLLCLAVAFVFAVYDGMKSIVDQVAFISRTGDVWTAIHASSQETAQAWLTDVGAPWVWDPAMLQVLNAPIWVTLVVVAILFILLGRRPRPVIGYARS